MFVWGRISGRILDDVLMHFEFAVRGDETLLNVLIGVVLRDQLSFEMVVLVRSLQWKLLLRNHVLFILMLPIYLGEAAVFWGVSLDSSLVLIKLLIRIIFRR